jgi:hypothetical protein
VREHGDAAEARVLLVGDQREHDVAAGAGRRGVFGSDDAPGTSAGLTVSSATSARVSWMASSATGIPAWRMAARVAR